MKKFRLGKSVIAILFGSVLISGSLVGCANTCDIEESSELVEATLTFEPEQHILYKHIERTNEGDRLVYHDGYSIVGVCASKGGPTKVLYVNNVEVTCSPRLVGTDYYYDNFGTPAEYTFDDEKTYILS